MPVEVPQGWTIPVSDLETYTPVSQTLIDHDIEVHVPSLLHRGPAVLTTMDLLTYTVDDNFHLMISALETYTPVSQTLIDHDIIVYTATTIFNLWGFELLPAGGGLPRAVLWGGISPQPFF